MHGDAPVTGEGAPSRLRDVKAFTRRPPPAGWRGLWGDGPADAMTDAIDAVVADFRDVVGRPPTREEIRQGLEFELTVRTDLTDERSGGARGRRPVPKGRRKR